VVLAKGAPARGNARSGGPGELFLDQYAYTCVLARDRLSSTLEKSKSDEGSDGAI
jgi:hypothetical protein